ncbi:hypothetical protein L1077_11345 [Pseudoalteromonas luteoviolacea]|nr:hypothetical protein [Pseudoalteromonas luteoviolacea]
MPKACVEERAQLSASPATCAAGDSTSQYVSAVAVDGTGEITITGTSDLSGLSLTLTPYTSGTAKATSDSFNSAFSVHKWECQATIGSSSTANANWLPATCTVAASTGGG